MVDCRGEAIYLISDVHSNLAALMVALKDIPETALVICAGDVVGYYIEPNEVCELLRERGVLCIQGNHDKYVLGELDYPADREEKYRIVTTRQVLTAENLQWLGALPEVLFLEMNQVMGNADLPIRKVCVAHGTPSSVEEYVYPNATIDFLAGVEADVLVLGHTHHPMMSRLGNLTVVNPGSVGQARDRIPGASYASIDPLSGCVEFFRADYPVATYQRLLASAGVNPPMIDILSRTIN